MDTLGWGAHTIEEKGETINRVGTSNIKGGTTLYRVGIHSTGSRTIYKVVK